MNRKVIITEMPHTQTTAEQTLTQEEKMNIEIFKRIMSEKKTRLPLLRNQGKTETEKIIKSLTYISINNITELNETNTCIPNYFTLGPNWYYYFGSESNWEKW